MSEMFTDFSYGGTDYEVCDKVAREAMDIGNSGQSEAIAAISQKVNEISEKVAGLGNIDKIKKTADAIDTSTLGTVVVADTLVARKDTASASESSSTSPALMVGDPAGRHIAMDYNSIMAKQSGTSTAQLNLNEGTTGGLVKVGSGGLSSDGSLKTESSFAAKGNAEFSGLSKVNTAVNVQNQKGAVSVINGDLCMFNNRIMLSNTSSYYNPSMSFGGTNNEAKIRLSPSNRPYDSASGAPADAGHDIIVGNTSAGTWAIHPEYDGRVALGGANQRFSNCYLASSTGITSDRKKKHDITGLEYEQTKAFVLGLKPVSFKYNDGTSGRTHYGLIAQDVKDIMDRCGMTSLDFAGYMCDDETKPVTDSNGHVIKEVPTGDKIYSLRYEEFISPMLLMIQNQQKEIDILRTELEDLKSKNEDSLK